MIFCERARSKKWFSTLLATKSMVLREPPPHLGATRLSLRRTPALLTRIADPKISQSYPYWDSLEFGVLAVSVLPPRRDCPVVPKPAPGKVIESDARQKSQSSRFGGMMQFP